MRECIKLTTAQSKTPNTDTWNSGTENIDSERFKHCIDIVPDKTSAHIHDVVIPVVCNGIET